MKRIKLLLIASLLSWEISAQNTSVKHLNFGTGFGSINPIGVDKNIYRNYSSSARYMIELERAIGKKSSWQSGIQFQFTSISVDAILHSNNHLAVAPDSIKYASINQMSIQLPIRYRFYNNEQRDGKFYQIGATLGYAFSNSFWYRYKNEQKEQTINQVQPLQCMINIGLGTRVKKKHVIYMDWSIPISPYFKQAHASSLYSMQLSFNVLL